jgi:site-specific recombinase XerD
MKPTTRFAGLLERFFTQRLMQQRQASAHTIASYRDTFRMLLQFAHKRLRKPPSSLALEDVDALLVMAFLDDLESTRGITARTRNLRLTAVHSFFRFVSYEAPDHAAQIQRVLAIPAKKFDRALVPFLSRTEVDALLAAPDQRYWSGRRDYALILRHTTAMDLLQAGVEQSVIALWLGHASIETTQIYLDADLELKERMLTMTTPPEGKPGRYRPDDALLAFLKSL